MNLDFDNNTATSVTKNNDNNHPTANNHNKKNNPQDDVKIQCDKNHQIDRVDSNKTDCKGTSNTPPIYSVSELNKKIRKLLEAEFSKIWIRGEISNFKAHSSGHFYFSLKDSAGQISSVMFRGFNSQLKFRPEDGMQVLIRGRVGVYEPRGSYQVFCETMEPEGVGALQIAFEQLKKKLQIEGLFDQKRKKPLPDYPQHIILVTSPTGAAIKDMLNVLKRRCKGLQITLVPVLVQGKQAPQSIIHGIHQANKIKDADVILCGRGGGSLEDLWGFNNEALAYAITESRLPIISAVGHEVDFTIADFVADLRAPTPSAAAELVVKNTTELIEKIHFLKTHLWRSLSSVLQSRRETIKYLEKALVNPKKYVQNSTLRCDELSHRMEQSIKNILKFKKGDLESQSQVLDSLSPLRVVKRGYSITKNSKGKVVKAKKDISVKEVVKVQISDALITGVVQKIDDLKKT